MRSSTPGRRPRRRRCAARRPCPPRPSTAGCGRRWRARRPRPRRAAGRAPSGRDGSRRSARAARPRPPAAASARWRAGSSCRLIVARRVLRVARVAGRRPWSGGRPLRRARRSGPRAGRAGDRRARSRRGRRAGWPGGRTRRRARARVRLGHACRRLGHARAHGRSTSAVTTKTPTASSTMVPPGRGVERVGQGDAADRRPRRRRRRPSAAPLRKLRATSCARRVRHDHQRADQQQPDHAHRDHDRGRGEHGEHEVERRAPAGPPRGRTPRRWRRRTAAAAGPRSSRDERPRGRRRRTRSPALVVVIGAEQVLREVRRACRPATC